MPAVKPRTRNLLRCRGCQCGPFATKPVAKEAEQWADQDVRDVTLMTEGTPELDDDAETESMYSGSGSPGLTPEPLPRRRTVMGAGTVVDPKKTEAPVERPRAKSIVANILEATENALRRKSSVAVVPAPPK